MYIETAISSPIYPCKVLIGALGKLSPDIYLQAGLYPIPRMSASAPFAVRLLFMAVSDLQMCVPTCGSCVGPGLLVDLAVFLSC